MYKCHPQLSLLQTHIVIDSVANLDNKSFSFSFFFHTSYNTRRVNDAAFEVLTALVGFV